MSPIRFLSTVIAVSALGLTAACGSTTSNARLAQVKQGELPSGATFKGVWYNPVFGELHMVPEGSNITAKYKSQQNGVWGVVKGTASGDVIKFEWEEHKSGAIGPGSTRKGKGYFKYVDAELPEQPKLKGEWGLNDNEVGGGEWDCVKQKDLEPKLDSIGGDADATVDTSWDADATKKNEPPPKPTPKADPPKDPPKDPKKK